MGKVKSAMMELEERYGYDAAQDMTLSDYFDMKSEDARRQKQLELEEASYLQMLADEEEYGRLLREAMELEETLYEEAVKHLV